MRRVKHECQSSRERGRGAVRISRARAEEFEGPWAVDLAVVYVLCERAVVEQEYVCAREAESFGHCSCGDAGLAFPGCCMTLLVFSLRLEISSYLLPRAGGCQMREPGIVGKDVVKRNVIIKSHGSVMRKTYTPYQVTSLTTLPPGLVGRPELP